MKNKQEDKQSPPQMRPEPKQLVEVDCNESIGSVLRYSQESQHQQLVGNLISFLGKKREQQNKETDSILAKGETTRSNSTNQLPRSIGRFEIESEVGKGSFGTVYRAFDTKMNRFVALKIPNIAGSKVEKWVSDEAKAIAQLQHNSIVNVFEVGQSPEGLPYIAMEFVENGTLQDLMAKRKLDPIESAKLVSQIAHGIAHAHRKQIYHRDLKPQNILLTEQNEPKIADFGLALSTEQQLNSQKEWAGSICYMSPEQVRQETDSLDGRSDVWSLGVIFYELLTGQVPFSGSEKKVTGSIQFHPARPPRQTDNDIPKRLEDICLKCLEKKVTNRYSTAKDLSKDIDRFLKTQSEKKYRTTIWTMSIIFVLAFLALLSLSIPPADKDNWNFGQQTELEKIYYLTNRIPIEIFLPADELNAIWYYKENNFIWIGSQGTTLLETGSTSLSHFEISVNLYKRNWNGSSGIFLGRTNENGKEKCQMIQLRANNNKISHIHFYNLSLTNRDFPNDLNNRNISTYRHALDKINVDVKEHNTLTVRVANNKVSKVFFNGKQILKIAPEKLPLTNGGFGLAQEDGNTVFRNLTFTRKRKMK